MIEERNVYYRQLTHILYYSRYKSVHTAILFRNTIPLGNSYDGIWLCTNKLSDNPHNGELNNIKLYHPLIVAYLQVCPDYEAVTVYTQSGIANCAAAMIDDCQGYSATERR